MSESRVYRINNLSVSEINWMLQQIADRLDNLEGFRGQPVIRDDIKITQKIYYEDANGTILHAIGDE